MKKTGSRLSVVELWRFVAAFVIASHHLYVTGISCSYIGANNGSIYVEFFLIITGYYTYMHFKNTVDETDSIGKNAVYYTIKKFRALIPYTTIAILIEFSIDTFFLSGHGIKTVLGSFLDMIMELLYLSPEPRVLTLWYMMALMIVYPVFSLFVQIKDKYIVGITAFVFSVVYYSYYLSSNTNTLKADWRILAGLMLGAFIGFVHDKAGEAIAKINQLLLTCIESATLILSLVFVLLNSAVEERLIILLFAIGLSVMLSGYSYTSKIQSPLLIFLGKLSIPLFIFHPIVAGIISLMLKGSADMVKISIFYLLSIAVSAFAVLIGNKACSTI